MIGEDELADKELEELEVKKHRPSKRRRVEEPSDKPRNNLERFAKHHGAADINEVQPFRKAPILRKEMM